jgi:hypothetical protein
MDESVEHGIVGGAEGGSEVRREAVEIRIIHWWEDLYNEDGAVGAKLRIMAQAVPEYDDGV